MLRGPKYVGTRASSIKEEDRYREDGTDEWYTTEDGYEFSEGDRLFDYYDCRWIIVGPLSYDGWFDCLDPITRNRSGTLNSVRVSKNLPDWYTGPEG